MDAHVRVRARLLGRWAKTLPFLFNCSERFDRNARNVGKVSKANGGGNMSSGRGAVKEMGEEWDSFVNGPVEGSTYPHRHYFYLT